MNTSSSQNKVRKLSIHKKQILRSLLTSERALLSRIENEMLDMRKAGISEEDIKENVGGSHKCSWHKICTYIHILNGDRGKAIKTFYKWRNNSNDLLWMIMEKQKTQVGKKCKIVRMSKDKDNIVQADAENVDDGNIVTYAKHMKDIDKIFCDALQV